jgi:hypothetical protein
LKDDAEDAPWWMMQKMHSGGGLNPVHKGQVEGAIERLDQ